MDFWNALDTVIEPVYPSSSPSPLFRSFSFFSSTCLASTGHSTRFNYAPPRPLPLCLGPFTRHPHERAATYYVCQASFRFVPLSASSDRSSCPYSTLLNVVELKSGGSSLRCQFFPSLPPRMNHEQEPVNQFVEWSKISPPFSLSLPAFSVVKNFELITNSRLVSSSPKGTKKKTLDSSSSSLSNKLLLSPFAINFKTRIIKIIIRIKHRRFVSSNGVAAVYCFRG